MVGTILNITLLHQRVKHEFLASINRQNSNLDLENLVDTIITQETQFKIFSNFSGILFGFGDASTVTETRSPHLGVWLPPKLSRWIRPSSPIPQSTKHPNGTTFLTTPGTKSSFVFVFLKKIF